MDHHSLKDSLHHRGRPWSLKACLHRYINIKVRLNTKINHHTDASTGAPMMMRYPPEMMMNNAGGPPMMMQRPVMMEPMQYSPHQQSETSGNILPWIERQNLNYSLYI